MGCFPVGRGAIDYHPRQQAQSMRDDSENYLETVGGRFVNHPLTTPNQTLTSAESAELEIRRTIRAGLDGFAVDA